MSKVLIIEEDPRIASALEVRFKACGYEVATTADVIVGGTLALQLKPDLICLDISRPGGIGLRLAAELSHRPETKLTPIIFLGSSKDPDLQRRTLQRGAAGLFEKPFDPEELVQAARHALGEITIKQKAPRDEASPTTPNSFQYT